ncbi:hypothetical protein D1872_322120 [compost metagenome]
MLDGVVTAMIRYLLVLSVYERCQGQQNRYDGHVSEHGRKLNVFYVIVDIVDPPPLHGHCAHHAGDG